MIQHIETTVLSRIYGHGRGWAFSPKDLQDLGRVDMALKRLADRGAIRRVIRGIYDYPQFSELLNQQLAPDIHQIAQALARKFSWRIHPDGMAAMNLIGLTTQVQSQFVFQSDGPNREYKVGKYRILFKKTALKEISFKNAESAIIVQALKAIGEDRIEGKTIKKIRQWLPKIKRPKVLKDTERVTAWIYQVIKLICTDSNRG